MSTTDAVPVPPLNLGASFEQIRDEVLAEMQEVAASGYYVLGPKVAAFEKASGRSIGYQIVDRRPGDIAECYADPARAQQELGWQAERDLEQMCVDGWRWQSMNPVGFAAS